MSDGLGNVVNCGDISSQTQAQACYEYSVVTTGKDIHGLDGDDDRNVCVSLSSRKRICMLHFEMQPDPAWDEIVDTALELEHDLLSEDEDIIVADKAAGLLTIATAREKTRTAYAYLRANVKENDPRAKVFIVHRLDRDTSGLLAVALTDTAHRHLSAQLQDRRLGRTYLTVSWGRWKEDQETLTGDIGRHPRFRQKMAVVKQGGKPAATRYLVLEDFGFRTPLVNDDFQERPIILALELLDRIYCIVVTNRLI